MFMEKIFWIKNTFGNFQSDSKPTITQLVAVVANVKVDTNGKMHMNGGKWLWVDNSKHI